MYNSKDVLSDTWISTDDEGRLTGTGTGVPSDKKVGYILFFLARREYTRRQRKAV